MRVEARVWAMDTENTYDFGAGFARLTGLLEDAAGVAAEGQAAGLSLDQHAALACKLGTLMSQANAALADVRAALGR